jgi:hypothetical protein
MGSRAIKCGAVERGPLRRHVGEPGLRDVRETHAEEVEVTWEATNAWATWNRSFIGHW